jgi:hypothetical protein
MSRVRTLSFALGFLALIAVPVFGQDITGTWVLSVDLGPTGGGDATFVFEQEGTALSGTYGGSLGDGIGLSGTVEDGKVTYQGTVEGTTMEGICIYGQLGDGTFEGSKSG